MPVYWFFLNDYLLSTSCVQGMINCICNSDVSVQLQTHVFSFLLNILTWIFNRHFKLSMHQDEFLHNLHPQCISPSQLMAPLSFQSHSWSQEFSGDLVVKDLALSTAVARVTAMAWVWSLALEILNACRLQAGPKKKKILESALTCFSRHIFFWKSRSQYVQNQIHRLQCLRSGPGKHEVSWVLKPGRSIGRSSVAWRVKRDSTSIHLSSHLLTYYPSHLWCVAGASGSSSGPLCH